MDLWFFTSDTRVAQVASEIALSLQRDEKEVSEILTILSRQTRYDSQFCFTLVQELNQKVQESNKWIDVLAKENKKLSAMLIQKTCTPVRQQQQHLNHNHQQQNHNHNQQQQHHNHQCKDAKFDTPRHSALATKTILQFEPQQISAAATEEEELSYDSHSEYSACDSECNSELTCCESCGGSIDEKDHYPQEDEVEEERGEGDNRNSREPPVTLNSFNPMTSRCPIIALRTLADKQPVVTANSSRSTVNVKPTTSNIHLQPVAIDSKTPTTILGTVDPIAPYGTQFPRTGQQDFAFMNTSVRSTLSGTDVDKISLHWGTKTENIESDKYNTVRMDEDESGDYGSDISPSCCFSDHEDDEDRIDHFEQMVAAGQVQANRKKGSRVNHICASSKTKTLRAKRSKRNQLFRREKNEIAIINDTLSVSPSSQNSIGSAATADWRRRL